MIPIPPPQTQDTKGKAFGVNLQDLFLLYFRKTRSKTSNHCKVYPIFRIILV